MLYACSASPAFADNRALWTRKIESRVSPPPGQTEFIWAIRLRARSSKTTAIPGASVAGRGLRGTGHGLIERTPVMKFWCITFVVMALLAASADDPPEGLAEKVRKASFVFKGTVIQTGASNVHPVEKSGATVVVKIDQVLKSPKMLKGFAGREVTVIFGQAHGAAAIKNGQTAIFFTEGAVYGEKLAVREVAARTRGSPDKSGRKRRCPAGRGKASHGDGRRSGRRCTQGAPGQRRRSRLRNCRLC